MKTSLTLGLCIACVCAQAANPQTTSFSNFSTNKLYVTDFLADGKPTGIPVGVLIPGGAKASAGMFPRRMPDQFTILFRKDSQSLTQHVSGKALSLLLKQAPGLSELTAHFIFSQRGEFILKVESMKRGGFWPHEAKLWPDENDPLFQKHKALARAAYEGKADEVRQALNDGAPFSWPENPIGISPLEWTARWNRERAFDELLKSLPLDYSPYSYANCIKLASQSGHTVILAKLLAKSLAKAVPPRVLQEIFYSACSSADTPAALEILLKHYPVGVDYRVRDYGHTLLMVAVQGSNHATVEWLLKHGADKDLTMNDGSKPINWARDERMRQLLK